MKKIICTLAAAACAFAAFSFCGCARGEASVNYTLSEDGAYYIVSGVSGDKNGLTSCEIPEAYSAAEGGEMLPVKEIGAGAFMRCGSLSKVTIPHTVTVIGDNAFSYCGLLELTIPESVTSIGYGAFGACDYLTEVTVPASVTTLSPRAFAYCSKLKTVYVKADITALQARVFYNSWYSHGGEIYTDTSLEKVYLPATLEKIHIEALEGNIITDIYFAGTKEQWNGVYFYEQVKKEGTDGEYEEKKYEDKSKFIPATAEIHFNSQF